MNQFYLDYALVTAVRSRSTTYDQELRSRFDWLREPEADAIASPPLFIAASEKAVTVLIPRGSVGMT
jgi:hypothetical protein